MAQNVYVHPPTFASAPTIITISPQEISEMSLCSKRFFGPEIMPNCIFKNMEKSCFTSETMPSCISKDVEKTCFSVATPQPRKKDPCPSARKRRAPQRSTAGTVPARRIYPIAETSVYGANKYNFEVGQGGAVRRHLPRSKSGRYTSLPASPTQSLPLATASPEVDNSPPRYRLFETASTALPVKRFRPTILHAAIETGQRKNDAENNERRLDCNSLSVEISPKRKTDDRPSGTSSQCMLAKALPQTSGERYLPLFPVFDNPEMSGSKSSQHDMEIDKLAVIDSPPRFRSPVPPDIREETIDNCKSPIGTAMGKKYRMEDSGWDEFSPPTTPAAPLRIRKSARRTVTLTAALVTGDAAAVRKALADGEDVNGELALSRLWRRYNHIVPLLAASAALNPNTPAILEILLSAGAVPEAVDEDGRTALHLVIEAAASIIMRVSQNATADFLFPSTVGKNIWQCCCETNDANNDANDCANIAQRAPLWEQLDAANTRSTGRNESLSNDTTVWIDDENGDVSEVVDFETISGASDTEKAICGTPKFLSEKATACSCVLRRVFDALEASLKILLGVASPRLSPVTPDKYGVTPLQLAEANSFIGALALMKSSSFVNSSQCDLSNAMSSITPPSFSPVCECSSPSDTNDVSVVGRNYFGNRFDGGAAPAKVVDDLRSEHTKKKCRGVRRIARTQPGFKKIGWRGPQASRRRLHRLRRRLLLLCGRCTSTPQSGISNCNRCGHRKLRATT